VDVVGSVVFDVSDVDRTGSRAVHLAAAEFLERRDGTEIS
jgi:hypothetical protein